MWTALITGVSALFKGWVDVKKSAQEAEAAYNRQTAANESTWDLEALRAARFSWKDEFITIIWFLPLLVAWVEPEKAGEWLAFVGGMPLWYQIGMFGIMAASFGLRWFFKQQSLKLGQKQ